MNYKKVTRLAGSRKEHLEEIKVLVTMFLATAVYELLSLHFVHGYSFNIYEFLGTWSGLICVWLSRTTNILCWPWGIFSSIMLGIFFHQIGLPGQEWLNLGYFLVIQLWAWPHWAFGGEEKTELPITELSNRNRFWTVLILIGGTVLVYSLIDVFVPGSLYPWLDSLVVSASVVAQYLLGKKKVENWILWLGPVNLLSIVLFFLTGAYTLTALYVAYFVHAAFALNNWTKNKK